MARVKDISWCEDERLQEDLRNYVGQNMKRKEMFDFQKETFPPMLGVYPHWMDDFDTSTFSTQIEMSLLTK